jgi:hypothetical protein
MNSEKQVNVELDLVIKPGGPLLNTLTTKEHHKLYVVDITE